MVRWLRRLVVHGTPPTVPMPHPPVLQEELGPRYVGLTLGQAQVRAQEDGLELRDLLPHAMYTLEFRHDRVSVRCEGGIVVDARRG